MENRIVCFDLETGGLDPETHPIIQFAAVALDSESLSEIDDIELKIAFRISDATDEALEVNSYDPKIWEKEARVLMDWLHDPARRD